MMKTSKTVLVSVLLSASLAFACGGSDDGKTTDTNGTRSSRSSRDDDGDDSRSSGSRDDRDDAPSSNQNDTQQENCSGSSICINGSCKCESGPQKGRSCCYAPEEEDDPPCAKANECDNVCNSCK